MGSMRSVPDCAEAIEGRNSEGGGEISVGATADGCLRELEAELSGGLGRDPVEAHGCLGALEGCALDASEKLEAAPWIKRAQLVEFSICARGLGWGEEPNIYDNFGEI